MCDHIVVLAQQDQRRWIDCCEHGTVHLAWETVSVRLPLRRLSAVAQALKECSQVALHYRIAAAGELCVVFDEHDLYQVWIGGVGLCLSPKEFRVFCRLVSSAGSHPSAFSAADALCDEPTHPLPDAQIRTTYHLFSLN